MCTREKPFQNMTTPQVVICVAVEGKRLPIPNDVADSFKDIITKCWDAEPKNRPLFNKLVDLFDQMIFTPPSHPVPTQIHPLLSQLSVSPPVKNFGSSGMSLKQVLSNSPY